MSMLSSTKINTRILALVLLPVAVIVWLSAGKLSNANQQRSLMQDLEVAIEYANVLSPLMVALDSEQQFTNKYIWNDSGSSSDINRTKKEMLAARDVAHKAQDDFEQFLERGRSTLTKYPRMAAELKTVEVKLERLKYIRLAADAKQSSSDAYKDKYGGEVIWTTVDILRTRMALVQSISSVVDIAGEDKELGMTANAYSYLLLASSASSILQEKIDTALRQVVDPYNHGQLVVYREKEADFRNLFVKYASVESLKIYEEVFKRNSVIDDAEKIYWDAFDTYKTVNQTPMTLHSGLSWSSASPAVNSGYKTLQREVLTELVRVKDEKVAHANAEFYQTVALLFVVLIGILVVSYIIASSISKPLKQFVKSFIHLAESKDMGLQVDERGENELAELGAAFNMLVNSFNEALIGVRTHASSMNSINVETAEAMRTALQLSGNQLTATDSISVAVNEMTATIQEVSNMAQNTSEAVQKAHEISVSSVKNADRSRELMESLTVELGNTSKVVGVLNDEATQISGVLNVIQGIAEQTNLLALNAAIEAARAGEMGRGFAVVADEVRSLARRTQESTEQIRDQVQSLLSGADSATENMAKLQQEGLRSVEIVMETSAAFNVLKGELDSITDMATQIAVATEEQTSVSNEINRRICAVKDDSEQLASQATTTMKMTDSVAVEGRLLQEHIDKFKTKG
ncbi:methyl-accepting chemotaxis protein [Saccharophagus degradans]|uniref:methyl-accepting chemotaxis protein n=1 Tax=Saccharophagus degradans TaxID=86304 RepID=UPI002477ED33|nr:methyl-accepting chemotaxis protein [Saccharophagus degradans]WGO99141.1 methyl-accepting chemotaxis protein [Saccharophagus degradans]